MGGSCLCWYISLKFIWGFIYEGTLYFHPPDASSVPTISLFQTHGLFLSN